LDSDTWTEFDAFTGFKSVSYSGGASRSVLFQSDGLYEQSLFWDNMQITPIPEPSTLVPASLLLLGLGTRRQARK
jgi:hypothetical protein